MAGGISTMTQPGLKDDRFLHALLDEYKECVGSTHWTDSPVDPEAANGLLEDVWSRLFSKEGTVHHLTAHLEGGQLVFDSAPPPLVVRGSEITLPDGQRLQIEMVPA
jgi:hypothetical protein